jgi:hypothetical protein
MHVINRVEGFVDLANTPGIPGREPCQGGWHPWIGEFARGLTVLDVGSGVSAIKEDLLTFGAKSVERQDACTWCQVEIHEPISSLVIRGQKWEVVTCLDVIEHIVDYGRFARDLVNLSEWWVIVTTPGAFITHNANVHHYHEFLPNEVVQLFEAAGAGLHAIRFFRYSDGLVLDATGEEARKHAATLLDVHPLGFVFSV